MDNSQGFEPILPNNEDTISVSQLNKLAKNLLENNLPITWIKGEISGIKKYSHVYFDLKDESSKISCVVFAKLLTLVDFSLENGQQIEVRGRVTIYPANGSYQINVERIRKVGLGALWEAYNRLLVKLRSEGLFDPIHKKKIPIFPKAIGLVTSKEGSVIRDVITTLHRRMPNIPIIVYHSAVQGSDASMQVAKAIRTANSRQDVDVLIVCRGGGSMEDLWCFNEEVVAREVYQSQIPIISAIGHETDTTIIDFVADLRAPTPTAAAELVARSRDEWQNLVNKLHYKLKNNINILYSNKQQQLDLAYARLKLLNPLNQLKQNQNLVLHKKQLLDNALRQIINRYKSKLMLYTHKLDINKINSNLTKEQQHLSRLEQSLKNNFQRLINSRSNKLVNLTNCLNLLNPQGVLSRGYAIVKNANGKIIQTSNQLKHHERIEIILENDLVGAIVDKSYNSQQGELL